MLDLPAKIIQVLRSFKGAFSERVWEWANVLLIGAILAPGERTVAAILRVMGRSNQQQFQIIREGRKSRLACGAYRHVSNGSVSFHYQQTCVRSDI